MPGGGGVRGARCPVCGHDAEAVRQDTAWPTRGVWRALPCRHDVTTRQALTLRATLPRPDQPARLAAAAKSWPEADVEEHVRAVCAVYGVAYYHHRWSKGTTPGFPDDVLIGTRVLFRECKRENGQPTPEQQECLDALAAAGQDVGVWRPSDALSGRIRTEVAAVSTRAAYRDRAVT